MKLKDRSYWRGFVISSVLHCLLQDWYGLERYVALCRAGWVDIHWFVWVPLLLLLWVYEAIDEDSKDVKSGGWTQRYRIVTRRPQ